MKNVLLLAVIPDLAVEVLSPSEQPVLCRNSIVGSLSGYQHFEAAPPHRFQLSSWVKWYP